MKNEALSQHAFESIVEAGIQAPSADNRHPLEFERHDRSIRVWSLEPLRSLSVHRRHLLLVSLGAVIENMVLRARAVGWKAVVHWFPDAAANLAVELSFEGCDASSDPLASAIPKRHTNRNMSFGGQSISPAQRRTFEEDAATFQGVELIWLDDSRRRRIGLRLLRLAEAERFRCRHLHEELFSSIRFDAGWTASVPEGLPPGSLGIERPLQPVFQFLRHWTIMRWLCVFGVHRALGWRAADWPCRFSPNLCLIASSAGPEEGALAGGRALERIWLRATSFGLAFQALCAASLYAIQENDLVRADLRETLSSAWREVAPHVKPVMVFRIGVSSSPSVRSGRRPVQTYLR